MLFIWPVFLLWLLGLWSINDIKINNGLQPWYKRRGTYGLLFIAIFLLSGIIQKTDSNNTGISSQASSIMVSSQSDKSDDQSSSEAKSSLEAEASSKAKQESIAASEKAASEASVRASSEAAVSSQNAASESAARAAADKEAEAASKTAEAKSVAQQTIAQPAPQNDTGRTVFVTGGGKSDVYWYSTSSMPARTNKNNIITMTEAEALTQGKRHSKTE